MSHEISRTQKADYDSTYWVYSVLKTVKTGVPAVAQREQTQLVPMRTQV